MPSTGLPHNVRRLLDSTVKTITKACRGGETGRHSGLKIRRQRKTACRFDSGPRHQDEMKVFNLCCDQDHKFEGWFASGEEFDRQSEAALIECPVCASTDVHKLLSAPRLNLGGPVEASDSSSKEPVAMPNDESMRSMMLQIARHVAANSEDVGERFPEEARRIHYDEAPKRSIRGMASKEEAAELKDEGIEVMPVPFGNLLKNPLQ